MFEQDPFSYTVKSIGNKWKPHVLWEMRDEQPIRFSTIRKRIPITERVLSQTLKELVSDGLVSKEIFAEIPPRVEYTITEVGQSTISILTAIYDWGRSRMLERGEPIDGVGEMRHGYLPLDKDKTENPSQFCKEADE